MEQATGPQSEKLASWTIGALVLIKQQRFSFSIGQSYLHDESFHLLCAGVDLGGCRASSASLSGLPERRRWPFPPISAAPGLWESNGNGNADSTANGHHRCSSPSTQSISQDLSHGGTNAFYAVSRVTFGGALVLLKFLAALPFALETSLTLFF